jgi:hypothetical protein
MSFWSVVVNGSPVDFATLGLNVTREFSGLGMPPITHNLQSYALQPGALYQSSKVQPRTLALTVDLEGSSYANMHTLRQALINIFAPTTPYYVPVVRIYYSGGTRPVYADFRYLSGLEWMGYEGFGQQVPLQLIATDPYWYEDDAETFSLGGQGSISGINYILYSASGIWHNMGGGTNGAVWAITADIARDRFYIGGQFTEAGGTDGCDNIFWWDSRNYVMPLDGGGIVGGTVVSIAVAANGDLWACNAQLHHYIAAPTDTWESFGTTGLNDVKIAPNGTLWACGGFTNFEGSGADGVVSYNGVNWLDVGTPANIIPLCLAISPNGTVYVSGLDGISSGITYVYRYDGSSTWTPVVTLTRTIVPSVNKMLFDSAGNLYMVGVFDTANGIAVSNVASWSGSAINAMAGGFADPIYDLCWSGGFLYVSPENSDKVYKWSGTAWYELALNLPSGSYTARAVAAIGSTLLVGGDFTGTATIPASSAVTPVSTASVYPVITLTLASGSAALTNITNATTGHVIYLDYTLNAGETITIDLSPGKKTIVSSVNGAIAYALLEGSDLANFCLAGGQANDITVASDNGNLNATLAFQTAHWSADGGSA